MIKLRKYEHAGVKEYWIVDPIHKTVNVFTIEGNNKYGKSDFYNCEDNIKVSIFPDLEIDLKTVFIE